MPSKTQIKTLEEARIFAFMPIEIESLEEAVKTKQAGALRYIDHLASVTKCYNEARAMPMDLYRKDDGRFETDRTKINQIFFTWREKCPPDKAKESTVPQEVFLKMQPAIKNHLDNHYWRLQEQLSLHHQEIEQAGQKMRSSEAKLLAVTTNMKAIQLLKDGDMDFRKEIERIIRDGYFVLNPEAASFLSFITSSEITLNTFNADQGREQHVNLGTIRVDVDMSTESGFKLTVLGHANNVKGSGTIHPHVSNSGAICWGELKAKALKAAAGLDLKNLMAFLGEILNSYNENDAYITIESLMSYRKQEADKLKQAPEPAPVPVNPPRPRR